ncbi:electron transport complex subunit RsxC [Fonticella tunisiensis]|uniref:Ion-translocating oxidoreductase complex subunit C n=1 Tax=Fonticella tunisiensis TaxID=1096341 RepID=A0A4R7KPT6_9CLOT|nr:electron transport complex subunit RsxC [Fonticella tunisiensis]TDT61131.1 electron transport complex protein RnfC [Fonticella tunisiensis]
MALTFKRGVHPPHGKHLTENNKIEYLLPKGLLVFPMVQHIGAPCEPLVKKGERVLLGQKIGEGKGFVTAPIHSSVSGLVKDIAPMPHPNGSKVLSIIVENDGLYEKHESLVPKQDYRSLSKEELLKIIQEAGVVGMGGATFPTHVKLSPPPDKKIDTIIINGAECEPYLTSDYRVMLEETQRVVDGLKIILHMFPGAKGYIGIEDNKPAAIEAVKRAVKDEANIEVKVLKTKYPQGGEKQLIYAITRRQVPSGKLPADVGCIVQNIETAVAIERAVLRGRPVMRRIVTVTGGAINNPKNFNVRIGTTYRELIEAAGGFKEEPIKIISGGPMMGIAIHTLDVPVTKGTSAILCLTREEAVLPEEMNCIRCGKCIQACPMNLLPTMLNSLALKGDYEAFEKYHGLDCIECGSCSFVCPSKRHLVQSIRTAKRTVLANKKKTK